MSRVSFYLRKYTGRSRPLRLFIMLLLAIGLIWGIVLPTLYVIYKPPTSLIRAFQSHWPDVLWEVQTSKKVIALTIDDAPSEYTNSILAVLEKHKASATFFVIGGQVHGREKILQNIVQYDNELGNHAMHDEPSRSLDSATLTSQIRTVEAQIHEAYSSLGRAAPPNYFRPGSGFFSTKMRSSIPALGYRMVLGGIYPHDPQISYPTVNANHILSLIRPGGIIICHDRREWTVPMLEIILPEIKRRGYEIVTITNLLKHAETVT